MKKIALLLVLAMTSSHALAAKVQGRLSNGGNGNYCYVTKPEGCPGAGDTVPASCNSTGWVFCGAYGGTCEVDFACGIATGVVGAGFDDGRAAIEPQRRSFEQ